MEPKMNKPNLYQEWSAVEPPYKDSDLAKKTFSYRFPVHIAARLAAIEEMFPNKTRTEVILGILKLGLAQFEESLPYTDKNRPVTEDEAHWLAEEFGENVNNILASANVSEGKHGPRVEYVKKANAKFVELEKERDVKNPTPPFKI